MYVVLKMGMERADQYNGASYRPVLDLAWERLLAIDLDEVARNAVARRGWWAPRHDDLRP